MSVTLGAVLVAPAQRSWAAGILYGADNGGDLFSIDVATGAGTLVGTLPNASSTEIECEPMTVSPKCFSQLPDGFFEIQQFDLATAAGIGGTVADGHSFTGLEYVGRILYGATINGSGGPSSLRTLNPSTGASSLIGPTGVGPISGLAFDTNTSVMYGIAGGSGPANLYTINLSSGAATLVGTTSMQAGSLEFGPDGNLYAGGTGPDAGNLFRINPGTGASTLVGPTGFTGGITGLTLVQGVPAAPVLSTWGVILAIASLLLIGSRRLGGGAGVQRGV
jgi:hypothetical protein